MTKEDRDFLESTKLQLDSSSNEETMKVCELWFEEIEEKENQL